MICNFVDKDWWALFHRVFSFTKHFRNASFFICDLLRGLIFSHDLRKTLPTIGASSSQTFPHTKQNLLFVQLPPTPFQMVDPKSSPIPRMYQPCTWKRYHECQFPHLFSIAVDTITVIIGTTYTSPSGAKERRLAPSPNVLYSTSEWKYIG